MAAHKNMDKSYHNLWSLVKYDGLIELDPIIIILKQLLHKSANEVLHYDPTSEV